MHLRLELDHSLAGTLCLALCGLIAITQVLLLPKPIALMIGLVTGFYLLREWRLLVFRHHPRSVMAIEFFADSSWQLELGDGRCCRGSAEPRSVFLHPLLVAMSMVDDQQVRHPLLIPADAVDSESFRRLRVMLRQLRTVSSDKT